MFCKFDFRHSCMFNTTKFIGNEKKEGKSETQLKNIVFQLDKGKFPEYTEDEEPFSFNFLWVSL